MLIILLGPPGVGKGTQCRRLAARFGWTVISTGEQLRAAIRNRTPLGAEAKAYIDAGQLVPDEVMNGLVREILAHTAADQDVLFDGFPRTMEQAQALDDYSYSADFHRTIRHVLLLTVDEAELRRRLMDRATKEGRSDDTPATITTRLETYHRQTEPLIQYYRSRGLLREVRGDGTPDEVFARICDVFATG
jgi:adenylate kinase